MKLLKYMFRLKFLFAVIALVLLPACNWFKNSQDMSVNRLNVLDVNEPVYYEDAHVAGAINVSYKEIDELAKKISKQKPVVVYCSSYQCTESTRVAQKLQKLGFTDVQVYKGGTQEWYQLHLKNPEQYPVVGPAQKKYLKASIEKDDDQGYTLPVISAHKLSKLLKENQ